MENIPDRLVASVDEQDLFAAYDRIDPPDLIDPSMMIDPNIDDWYGEPSVIESHDAVMDGLERVCLLARVQTAARYRMIGDVLRDAEQDPDPWVGADPTLDPLWVDPRQLGVAAVRRERREFAVRAAAADIAVRLRMSEPTVRTHAHRVDTLRARCPRLWDAFLNGQVSEQNAMTTAHFAASLPDDDTDAWAVFDTHVLDVAGRMTPATFRVKARSIRERVHPESLEDRHRRAAEDRNVWVTPELDGMAVLTALLPAVTAHTAVGELDARARHLHAQADETRTLGQLRADVLADLIATGASIDTDAHADADAGGGGRTARAAVAVTIPVLSLLGKSDEPAILHGYGPIDLDTAKRLAGSAKSWVRVLTHPVTGTVLDVDRRTYRVPEALRRWLGVTHPVCVFSGCSRLARDCHIDHLIDWQHGGKTAASSLAPECEPHHRLRHGSTWTVAKEPDSGEITWTSPTGFIAHDDPPPF